MARLPLLERLDSGDHLCLIVDDDIAGREALTDAVRAGLRGGDRVLYCSADTVEALGRLRPAVEAIAGGDLRVRPIESSYLSAGVFHPAAALRFLRQEVDDARDAGYRGLRLLTDMSWASRSAPGVDRLPEYEAEANTIFAEGYAMAVCAYDPRLFDPLSRRGLAQAHLGTVATGEPFDPSSALRVRPVREPFGIRLLGEADLLNHAALRAVIDHLLGSLPGERATATVDLTQLRFIDTAAARVLLLAYQRGAGRLKFVGRPTALARLFDLHGAGEPAGTV
ncbi:MEDS domain-containing protein [Actinoplanes sp. NPDC051861]|uniref:MEDS domain-containing protein n=1 Tax=Actinoplanes sp. NPDC051861 TaxID=3155170 RepID=UPI003413F31B